MYSDAPCLFAICQKNYDDVLSLMRQHPSLSLCQISNLCQLDEDTVYEIVDQLIEQGLIVRNENTCMEKYMYEERIN